MTSITALRSPGTLPPAHGASFPPSLLESGEEIDTFVQEFIKHDGSDHSEPVTWSLVSDLAIHFAGARPLNENNSLYTVPTFNTSSIVDFVPNLSIIQHLDRSFFAANDEQFEPGMDSYFSANLQGLCAFDPYTVMDHIKTKLAADHQEVTVMAEAVRWVARQEAISIREAVVDILCSALVHRSPLVRDSGALGLAYLLEVQALVPLQSAMEREKEPELRQDLEDLIRSLDG